MTPTSSRHAAPRSRHTRRAVLCVIATTIAVVTCLPVAARAAWPGRNGVLLVWSAQGAWTVHPDGRGFRRVRGPFARPPKGPSTMIMSAGWSPDGRSIVWLRQCAARDHCRPQTQVVEVSRADGSRVRRVRLPVPGRFTAGPDGAAAFSPDGRSLIFARGEPGEGATSAIFTSSVTGQAQRLLAIGEPADPLTDYYPGVFAPQWSPTGKQIAVIWGQSLYAIAPDGSNPHPIYPCTGPVPTCIVRAFDWAPDGHQLALAVDTQQHGVGGEQIVVINADGSNPRTLRYGNVPFWSPDGDLVGSINTGRSPDGKFTGSIARAFNVSTPDGAMARTVRLPVTITGATWQPLR